MPMHEVIRVRRKALGLTQERLADCLGVSTPAVNKWEKGVTSPDLGLLSPLARMLGVDLNTLLCFREELTQEELGRVQNEVVDTMRRGGYGQGFQLAMETVRRYPACGPLLHVMALLLDGSFLMYGGELEDKDRYEKEILGLYERAARSGDEKVRARSAYMLAAKYMGRGELDRARELLDLMPEWSALDKRLLQARLLAKEEKSAQASELLERKLLNDLNGLQGTLLALTGAALEEGDGARAEAVAEVWRQAAELFDMWEYSAYVAPLEAAVGQKKVRESLDLLGAILAAALKPWDMGCGPLYRHIVREAPADSLGARLLPTLLDELERTGKDTGLATLCIASGMGAATIIERV